MNIRNLVIVSSVALLTACGGGGGGGSSNSSTSSTSNVTTINVTAGGTYLPLVNGGAYTPVISIYAHDLNYDGIDEIIVAGNKAQANMTSAADTVLRDFNMQIFGWNHGIFDNETADWFAGSDNVILGTGALVFGDFDGNGFDDIAVSQSADNELARGTTLTFFNNGNGTLSRTTVSNVQTWAHDMVAHDFNHDGYPDIMITDYGTQSSLFISDGPSRTFTTYTVGDYSGGASGISVADYYLGGEDEIMLTDNGTDEVNDTKMRGWTTSGGTLQLPDTYAAIPGSRYTQAQADLQTHSPAHAVRNMPMDFNNDGIMDVVVFERLDNESTVQFLSNDGYGTFTDVTDSTLVNYDITREFIYQPKVEDVNNDGHDDIILGHQILLQTADGKFVGSYSNVYHKFRSDINAASNQDWIQSEGEIVIVTGPNQTRYLAGNVVYEEFNPDTVKATIYISKLVLN
jgi:hypothetical protein